MRYAQRTSLDASRGTEKIDISRRRCGRQGRRKNSFFYKSNAVPFVKGSEVIFNSSLCFLHFHTDQKPNGHLRQDKIMHARWSTLIQLVNPFSKFFISFYGLFAVGQLYVRFLYSHIYLFQMSFNNEETKKKTTLTNIKS